MAGKPSKISEQGRKYLEKNPTATAQEIAIKIGMSLSGVQVSKWWKERKNPRKCGKEGIHTDAGIAYLKNNPKATAQEVAVKIGMSISGVQQTKWWKNRNTTQSN